MSKPRILFVIPSLSRAGAETQLVELVNGLDPERFSKFLFTFQPRQHQADRIDSRSVAHTHRLRRYKFDFAMVPAIARLIDEEEIDVVHCTLQFALLMGWLAVRRASRKPVLSIAVHTTLNRDSKDEFLDRALYQWLMRSCARVLFVCKSQRDHWENKYPFLTNKSVVIYNGIDAEHFDPSHFSQSRGDIRVQLGIPHDAPAACCVARFLPEKGHRLLLQALPAITQANPDAHFLLAGDGPMRAEIQAATRQAGLDHCVHFLGLVDDVRPVLAASDVTIMPSYTETFSMAMLESLAMSVPIVATNLGGTGEAVIPGQTGFLVEPRSPQALADAVVTALDLNITDIATLGTNGRELVQKTFSKQAMIAATGDLLTELATHHASARD